MSYTVSVAERAPVAVGVKVTVTRQVANALRAPALGQVLAFVIWKSPGFFPLRLMLEILNATVLLVSVSVELCAALVVPWVTEPNCNDAGNNVAVGMSEVPVPLKLIAWLPWPVLSYTVSVAEREPVAVGVKVTVTRHVANALIVPVFGQVLAFVIRKSPGFDPLKTMLETFSATVVLVSVNVELCAALVVPWVTEPNFRDPGTSVAVGAAVPVPVRVTTSEGVLPVLVTVSVPLKLATTLGVKVTVTVQLAPPLRVVQSLVCENAEGVATMPLMVIAPFA